MNHLRKQLERSHPSADRDQAIPLQACRFQAARRMRLSELPDGRIRKVLWNGAAIREDWVRPWQRPPLRPRSGLRSDPARPAGASRCRGPESISYGPPYPGPRRNFAWHPTTSGPRFEAWEPSLWPLPVAAGTRALGWGTADGHRLPRRSNRHGIFTDTAKGSAVAVRRSPRPGSFRRMHFLTRRRSRRPDRSVGRRCPSRPDSTGALQDTRG